MKRLYFLIIILFNVIAILNGQKSNFDTVIVNSQKTIEGIIIKNKIPGLAVTISIADSIVWSKGFGYADLEQHVQVDPSRTKFRIGSISKSFTSIAIGMLVEQNKIDLDVPIQNYVPNFPSKEYPVSIRQLGGHLAGIRNYNGSEFYNGKHYQDLNEGLNIFMLDSLLFKPNTEFYYSNYGWNLISVAIENVSETDFISYMEKNIFQALKMSSTIPDYNDSLIYNRSRFYGKDSLDILLNAPYVDNSYKWAAGGYLSTTHDLVKFGGHLLHPEIISDKTLQILIENQKISNGTFTDYGIGWMLGNINDTIPFFGHSGTAVGGKSVLIIVPKYELVFALAANIDDIDFGEEYEEIFKILKQFIKKQN